MNESFDFLQFAEEFEKKRNVTNGISELSAEDFKNPSKQDISDKAKSPLQSVIFELAALSGNFAPQDLIPPDLSENDRLNLTKLLYEVCIIDEAAPGLIWLLKSDTRAEIIEKLIKENRLLNVLSNMLPPTDDMGVALREILRAGPDIKLSDLSIDALKTYALALEHLRNIDINKPDEGELRDRINRANYLLRQGLLTNRFFVGRNYEIQELVSFVEKDGPDHGSWDGLCLTGMGGAGKSALLEKFQDEMFRAGHLNIALLDFDRPGIEPTDGYWLVYEIARQLQLQKPEIKESISEVLDQIRIERLEDTSYQEIHGRETSTRDRLMINELLRAIDGELKSNSTIIIILDTYEEVIQRNATELIVSWLNNLSEILASIAVKVIFSGRLFKDTPGYPDDKRIATTVEVGEFDQPSAELFLKAAGVTERQAAKLSKKKTFLKNPLNLRLLVNLILREGWKGIERLEKDIREIGHIDPEIHNSMVYRRVLRRLENDDLRKVAYPGLVMRYLSPELIRDIVAPVVGLGKITLEKAQNIFEELASYGWLAYRQGNQLWHRKDLRRDMLKVMIGKDPEEAKKIHQAAILFFENSNTEAGTAEALYHHLMLQDTVNYSFMNESKMRNAMVFLQADLEDLPKSSRVYLDYITYQKITLSDLEFLPAQYRPQAARLLGEQYIRKGNYRNALLLIKYYSDRFLDRHDDWAWETLYSTGSWLQLRRQWQYNLCKSPDFSLNKLYIGLIVDGFNDQELSVELRKAGPVFESISPDDPFYLSKLERMLFCGIVLKSRGILPNELQHMLLTVRIADPRFRFLVRLLAGVKPLPNFLMHPTYVCLNKQWVETRLSYTTSERIHKELGEVVTILNAFETGNLSDISQKQKLTVRYMLDLIDKVGAARARLGNYVVPIIDTGIDFNQISGQIPELRLPCRFVLKDLIRDERNAALLNDLFTVILNYKFDELKPEQFFNNLKRDPDRTLDILIEVADRSWQLGKLLKEIMVLFPANNKINDLVKISNLWSKSFEAVWSR